MTIHLTKVFFNLIFIFFAFSSAAFADPFDLFYSGRLTEESGAPVQGPINLELKFFLSETGTDEIGVTVPVFSNVVLNEGTFGVTIDLTPAQFNTIFSNSSSVWIQVKDVTHDQTYPRQTFSAVPYAMRVPVDEATLTYDTNGKVKLKNVNNLQGNPISATTPTPNYFLKWDGSSWIPDAVTSTSGGDMLKSVYDSNTNNIVDNAEALGGQAASYYRDASNINAGTLAEARLANAANWNSAYSEAQAATASNTNSTIVKRDGSGNFTAGTITANLTGNVTGNVTGDVTGNVSGTSANVTGTVAIANGGTGQATANAALNALLPSQGASAGKYLTTNGTNSSWDTPAGGSSSLVAKSADYTILSGDNGKIFNVTAAAIMTLPSAADVGATYQVTIRRGGAGKVRILPVLSQTIDGDAEKWLMSQYSLVKIASDGSNWAILFKEGNVATSDCTTSPQTFTYTGANQTVTVPSGCYSMTAKMWGAGGAGSGNTAGGGGGYSIGTHSVSPGDIYIVVVGGRGVSGGATTTYGGGGRGGGGGSGGGRSAVRHVYNTFDLITAGGGGGGGTDTGAGGAGGGTSGSNGTAAYYGYGGTQNSGGSGGSGGEAGSQFLGGAGASSSTGGGGGGYFGGGGGGTDSVSYYGPGGGGSGFLSNATSATTTAGSGATPGNSGDADRSGAGAGGAAAANGAHGRVIISWQ